ncbi:hypothetical protein WN55_01176 [Dufourea novaeangliae]|uniref:Uncharacterized protein n=1 Tax=Dufourea novaeangliae TaxID=178035 RepID=A0A154PEC1_DUFNO|nr:hypothetical protein WN55_01176 [Dufourea novaeangliae]
MAAEGNNGKGWEVRETENESIENLESGNTSTLTKRIVLDLRVKSAAMLFHRRLLCYLGNESKLYLFDR